MDCQGNKGSKGHSCPLAPSDSLVDPQEINSGSGENFYSPSTTPPQNLAEVKPFVDAIKPLTSTGLFSPPSTLPPVTLPPHPPISPIASGQAHSESGSSLATPKEQKLLDQPIQSGLVQAWVDRFPTSPSIEWDHYTASPSFNQDEQFWRSRGRVSTTDFGFLSDNSGDYPETPNRNRKIQIVSTQSSDLETLSNSSIVTMSNQEAVNKGDQYEFAMVKVKQDRDKITYKMRTFGIEDVDPDDIPLAHEKLKEVDDLLCIYWANVDSVIASYSNQIPPEGLKALQESIPELKSQVKAYEKSIRAKIKSFNPIEPKALSSYEDQMLEIQKKMMEIELNKEKRNNDENKALVVSKAGQVREKLRKLEELIKLVDMRENKDYWVEVDDTTITRTMKDLSKWDLTLNEAEDRFLEFKNLVALHGEPTDTDETGYDSASIKSLLLEMRLEVKDAKTTIQDQDKKRCLFSLETNKGEFLKYPNFSGELGEDLAKFKEKMEYRFRMNQVPVRLQLEKLRECLKGPALKQVPDSTKDVAAAWKNLSDAFGDPSRVLQYRLNILRDMGNFPAKVAKGAPNHGKRVEFLLKLEGVVGDIVDLGNSDDELMLLSFNANTIGEIVNKFPDNMVLELNNLPGRGKERMLNIQKQLSKFRADAQSLEKTRSLNTPVKSYPKQTDKQSDKSSPSPNANSFVSYNPPKRDPDCRVCLHMRDVQNKSPAPNTVFFENHLSNYITGCPQFISMDMSSRFNIIREVKICEKCFHPEVTYSREHEKECTIKDKKSSFSCVKCNRHSWICKNHKEQNKAKLDKFRKDYRDKHKLKLVFAVILPSNSVISSMKPSISPVESVDVQSILEPTISCNNSTSDDIGTAKAFRAMKKRLKANGFKGEINPPPSGEPMFLFFGAQGRHRPVNIMFDNGCSHAVYREGIPGKELRGMITHKGPFHMKGVGGIVTKANDQWLCALDTPGGKQFVSGLTVDQVTGDFPIIPLGNAIQELKADKVDDPFLQSCRIPPSAGGVTDMLMGIMYSNLFPVLVHSLPSGLGIYKTVLSSHGNKYNCMIGGPHRSFENCAGHAGGVAQMLAHFTEGIKMYQSWGPPKLDSLPMTNEEIRFAQKANFLEGDMDEINSVILSNQAELSMDNFVTDENTGSYSSCIEEISLDQSYENCSCDALPYCCKNYAELERQAFSNISNRSEPDIDKAKYLKQFILSQDKEIQVEYRCVKCRECWSCKNADESEKLSLREEQENQRIKDSVRLNFETKSIECTLPTRGSEQEFLSSNRDIAEKVLCGISKKYHHDENVRLTILAAFQKLFDKGFAKFLSDLTDKEKEQFMHKDPQHFLVWRVVFGDSVTTPCRPVFDGSQRTKKRADGSGGRCLNDLVVKGSVNNLNLLRLVLRWLVGQCAVTGDLAQFYNSCKLAAPQWNLQRFLWQADLNPNSPIQEGVITTLIYGVKSVSAQSEYALELLSDDIEQSDPELAKFIRNSRYCDDLGDLKKNEHDCDSLTSRADDQFARISLECKGWSRSGKPPPERVSKNGMSVNVAGLHWFPEVDAFEIKIPPLHFSRRSRGRLDHGSEIFTGSFGELDSFVPTNLTRRIVASKCASLFDLPGKLVPITIGLKSDLRKVVQNTAGWDDPMDISLRNKWVENFMKLEKLRGLKFHRPIMPPNAVDSKLRLITGVDAALEALIIGTWGGFKLDDGSWSCKLIIGRGFLAPSESTIPRNELESMCAGSNLSFVVRKALEDWVDSSIIVSDSNIALCWITAEHKRLSMFHRNRVIQIRRLSNLNELYHVKTKENPSDIGTRPEKVAIDDVGPESVWESGEPWMRGDISTAVDDEILKPVCELRLNKESEEEYSKGILFDSQIPEVITRGHVVNANRVSLLQERAEFSDYPLLPTKYAFTKTVRIYSYVMAFIMKCRRGRKFVGPLLSEGNLRFSSFVSQTSSIDHVVLVEHKSSEVPPSGLVSCFSAGLESSQARIFSGTQVERVGLDPAGCDRFISLALLYLFRKASQEVKEFNSVSLVKKRMIEIDGVLVSKNRMVDGLEYLYSGELNIDLGSLGIKLHAPVLDRFSPLAYCVADHVHWKLAPHKGMETQNRVSLEHVHILQGMSLYKEISLECIRCNMRRKQFIKAEMGGLSKFQLAVAPPFWTCQMDLFGPYKTYVPGHERTTRNKTAKECQVYIMCAVCPTSRLVNLQVIEKADASGILCGVTRLVCEVGFPKFFFIDQHSATMAAFGSAEFDLRDLQLKLHRHHGIIFETCSVGGHDSHGLVERVIQSLQNGLNDCGLKESRLHATGLQSLCKLVENAYNSIPIGYSYDRDQDNTSKLKIITPNMLKMGRTNQRTLDGPIRLARGSRELLDRVESLYDSWFRVWQDTVVPKLLFQPKWYDSDRDLGEGDLVFFQKKDGKLEIRWVLGRVDQVVKSERDGKIRRVIVRYQNEKESFGRTTDRSVRKLVRLFSIDEHQVQEDLGELQRRIDELRGLERHISVDKPEGEDMDNSGVLDMQEGSSDDEIQSVGGPAQNTRRKACNCCCLNHCKLRFHTLGKTRQAYLHSRIDGEVCSLFVPELHCEVGVLANGEEEDHGVSGEPFEAENIAGILRSLDLGL